MNLIIRPILLLLLIIVLSSTRGFAQYDSILYNSLYRTYLVHTPLSYDGSAATPLLIAMHGGFGNAFSMENRYLISDKADSAGFIVVYPEGVKSPFGVRTWNAGGCCGYAMNNNIDDVGFIAALIDILAVDYNIDTMRIYATGMSNGGFMSYRLACELSGKIAAIAPVASSMNIDVCNPQRPVPVIHFHSFLDTNVPYQGGIGTGPSNHYNPPLDSVLNVWAGFNNCTVLNDTIYNGNDYLYIKWSDCDCNSELNFYITYDGGHSWPGAPPPWMLDSASTVINANDLMWNFFSNYTLECNITGIEDEKVDIESSIMYPNPVNDVINIQFYINGKQKLTIELLDISGKKICTISDKEFAKGEHLIQWETGSLASGIYFIDLKGNKGRTIDKITVIK